ncbi:hypothetical protein KY345_03435 [Candidatus Woesearchaeota archaeon]|nr:hypothetical protein [Candidatus Woesearchaeota archaeon]
MIKSESIDILRTAKEALKELGEKRIEKAVDLIDHLTSVSDNELEQLLNKILVESDIKESKILFFDVVHKAREIKLYALKAKFAVVKGKYSAVKKFLNKIIELEDTEIKQINRLNKIVLYKKAHLWDRLILETAFIMFTRNRLQPFAHDLSEELDSFFKQKISLETKLRKKFKYKFLSFESEIKQKLFEREQMLLKDDSLANEIKHPIIIPHYDTKISFKKIFNDYLYIAVLGIMSYSILTKNFFHIVRKFNIMKKVRNFYAKLAFDFDSDYDMLVIETKKMTNNIKKLNNKLRYLINKTQIIKSKKAMKELAEEYGKFLISSNKKLNKYLDLFELRCQETHDSITKYVIREREKLQDIIERAEIR